MKLNARIITEKISSNQGLLYRSFELWHELRKRNLSFAPHSQ